MEHRAWGGVRDLVPEPPSTYYYRQIYGCFFRDHHGLSSLDEVGVDNITFETDYPHTDSTWPDTMEVAEKMFSGLDDATIYKIVRGQRDPHAAPRPRPERRARTTLDRWPTAREAPRRDTGAPGSELLAHGRPGARAQQRGCARRRAEPADRTGRSPEVLPAWARARRGAGRRASSAVRCSPTAAIGLARRRRRRRSTPTASPRCSAASGRSTSSATRADVAPPVDTVRVYARLRRLGPRPARRRGRRRTAGSSSTSMPDDLWTSRPDDLWRAVLAASRGRCGCRRLPRRPVAELKRGR